MYFKNSEGFNINVFFSFKSFFIFKQPMNCKNIKKIDLSKDSLLLKRLASQNICFLPGYFEQIDR